MSICKALNISDDKAASTDKKTDAGQNMKKKFWADYEQLLSAFFYVFLGKETKNKLKNLAASELNTDRKSVTDFL